MFISNRSWSPLILIAITCASSLLSSRAFVIQEPGKAPSLGFDDPIKMEFIGLTKEQETAIDKIRKQWIQEHAMIAKVHRGNRESRQIYSKYQAKCRANLSDQQSLRLRQYNLITNFGPSEISLLDRTFYIRDPLFTTEQSRQLLRVRKEWVELASKKLSNQPEMNIKAESDLLATLIEQHGTEIRKELFGILTRDQAIRFSQLELQTKITYDGVYIFSGSHAAEALEFSHEQSQKIQEILDEIQNLPGRFESARLKMDGYKTIFNSFSIKQKKLWREKLGAPANVTNVNWLENFMNEDLESLKAEKE